MVAPNVRAQLNAPLDTMSDEEIAALRYAEAMQSASLPEDYDEANDQSIGYLSGTTDLATQSGEMLKTGFRQSPS